MSEHRIGGALGDSVWTRQLWIHRVVLEGIQPLYHGLDVCRAEFCRRLEMFFDFMRSHRGCQRTVWIDDGLHRSQKGIDVALRVDRFGIGMKLLWPVGVRNVL